MPLNIITSPAESSDIVGCYSPRGGDGFDAAINICQESGAHLVVIGSALENSAVAGE